MLSNQQAVLFLTQEAAVLLAQEVVALLIHSIPSSCDVSCPHKSPSLTTGIIQHFSMLISEIMYLFITKINLKHCRFGIDAINKQYH